MAATGCTTAQVRDWRKTWACGRLDGSSPEDSSVNGINSSAAETFGQDYGCADIREDTIGWIL